MPVFKETDLKKHLSSDNNSNLYLIYGDEKKLVSVYTDLLIKKLVGELPSEFNYHVFDNDADISQISIACDVMPFVSNVNCVRINDLNVDLMPADEFDDYLKIIKSLTDTTVLIMSMPTLDISPKTSKTRFKKLCDLVSKNGIVAEIGRRSELQLEKTLCTWAKNLDCSMSRLTASKLIKASGTDLNVLHSEVDKLSAFADKEEITPEMIDMMVTKNLEAKIYDLFDFVIGGNGDKAMQTLDVLFYQREEPVSIVIVLGMAYVDMYRARVASENAVSTKEVAEKLSYKNRAWVLDKMLKQSRNITTGALRKSIDEIVSTNERLVSVNVNSRIELEKLLAKLILIAKDKSDG